MKPFLALNCASLAILCGLVAGCSGLASVSGAPAPNAAKTLGNVRGGQQPVTGATIQLYAVGTTGNTPTALLSPAVLTDATGAFDLTGLYTCPSSSALIYITATGGNPGLAPGTNNAAIAEMAALGACGSLGPSTFIQITEVTTVAAAMALAPFTTAPFNIGSTPTDAAALAAAFANAAAFADFSTGTSPGFGQSSTPTSFTPGVPVATINTLANILAACINSAGGVATDTSTPCGMLFSLTDSPTDTLSAIVAVAQNPAAYNTNALFALTTSTAPFQPQLPLAPATFAVALQPPTGGSPSILVVPTTLSPGDALWVAQTGTTCIYGFPSLIQINGSLYATGGTQQCGLLWGNLPANTPYGIISGVAFTSSNGQQYNHAYQFYVNVVPKVKSAISIAPTTVVWEGTAGSPSYTIDVALNNNTSGPLTLGTPFITGVSAANFSVVSNQCGATLPSGSSPCLITLRFSPPDAAFHYATLVMSAIDTAQMKHGTTVNLAGSGQY